MGAQDCKLNVERGVEHHVGRLLEGQDPALFGLADILPLRYGLLCGEGTLVVVADDAAQEAVVLCWNPVVVVERDAGERRYEDLELHRRGNTLGEQWVEGMYAFDDEYAVGLQLDALAVVLALSGDEVILGNLYALAGEEAREVVVEQVAIDGLDVVEVVAAVGQQGRVDAVDEVVVGGE